MHQSEIVFLACGKKDDLEKILSRARTKIADDLKLVDKNLLHFVGS